MPRESQDHRRSEHGGQADPEPASPLPEQPDEIWDVFLLDDQEEPEPEYGDFWYEPDEEEWGR